MYDNINYVSTSSSTAKFHRIRPEEARSKRYLPAAPKLEIFRNSTNACHKTCIDNKDVGTILRNIPEKSALHICQASTSKAKHHSCQKQCGAYAS